MHRYGNCVSLAGLQNRKSSRCADMSAAGCCAAAGRSNHPVVHVSGVLLGLDILEGYGNHENVSSIALCIRMIQ